MALLILNFPILSICWLVCTQSEFIIIDYRIIFRRIKRPDNWHNLLLMNRFISNKYVFQKYGTPLQYKLLLRGKLIVAFLPTELLSKVYFPIKRGNYIKIQILFSIHISSVLLEKNSLYLHYFACSSYLHTGVNFIFVVSV